MQKVFKLLLILTCAYLCSISGLFAAEDVEIRSHQLFIVMDGSKEASLNDPERMDADASRMILSVLGEYNAASVLMAGKKTKTFSKLQYGFKEHSLHLLCQKIKKFPRRAKTADFNHAIKTVLDAKSGIKYSDDIRSSIVLIMGGADPVSPEELMVDDLIEAGIRLYVIRLVSGEMTDNWFEWEEAAISTNAMFIDCGDVNLLSQSLFDIYLRAVGPQLLEVTGDTFKVDRVTTEINLVTKIKQDLEYTLVSPDNWRIKVKNGKTSAFHKRNVKISFHGSLMMCQIDQPKPGLWALKGADQDSVVAMTKSRQIVKLLLPRRRYAENEKLIITSYLARDGNIVRLQDKTEEIGFISELLDSSQTQVSSSPLMDDGKFPDTIRGDGVFSAFIPLDGREGNQSLRVVTRMQMLSRKIIDHIQVDAGSWVDIIEPYEPILEGSEAKLLIELSETPHIIQVPKIYATYDGQKLKFKPDPAHRYRHFTMLPAMQTPGLHELVIFKRASSSPLIVDKQSTRYNIMIVAKDNTLQILMIFGGIFIFINFTFGCYWFGRKWWNNRKSQPVEKDEDVVEEFPDDVERVEIQIDKKEKTSEISEKDDLADRIEELESSLTPGEVSGEVLKDEKAEPAKKPEEEMESDKLNMMESVSDRIGDIVAAQMGDPIKGDVDQSGLNAEDLDHDGDPDYAQSSTLDAVEKMLDFGMDASAMEESETEKETDEDAKKDFSGFSSDEMDELFGGIGGKLGGEESSAEEDVKVFESDKSESSITEMFGNENDEKEVEILENTSAVIPQDSALEDMFKAQEALLEESEEEAE